MPKKTIHKPKKSTGTRVIKIKYITPKKTKYKKIKRSLADLA